MKIAIPKTAEKYLLKTEHAAKHAYSGLSSCWDVYREASQHIPPPVVEDGYHVWKPPKTPEEQAEIDRYLELADEYFELKISEAMHAGFILQTAHMAIRLYSRNETIPPSCASYVSNSQRAVIPYCIGKERHGILTGLIVYAGRNQFSHWDEESPHRTTTEIFDRLAIAFQDSPFSDLAFSLSNPTIPIYASEILITALGWNSYEDYYREMTELLG